MPFAFAWESASHTRAAVVPNSPRWTACVGADQAAESAECATLQVPLDHADPRSRTIGLPVRRARADDQTERLGVLVTIDGGPGQRGTLSVRPGAHTKAIEDHFDIVSWDPRGTSGETLIDCIPEWDPFVGLDRTPDTDAEQGALDTATARLATRCRELHADVLPYVGTLATALDLESLRQLLDEPRISILGSSYGSEVALTYATLFPEHVRAVVLDGYSDPNLSPGEREVEGAGTFEHELDTVLAECGDDPLCHFRHGGEPGPALDRLLAALDREPVAAGDGARLTQSEAYEAILGSLTRDRPTRHRLLEALAEAEKGNGEPLLGMANETRRAYEASGLNQGAFMAIYCADRGAWWRHLSPAEVAELADRVLEVAPRLGRWLWSPPSDSDLPPVGLCAMQVADAAMPAAVITRSTDMPIDAAGAGPILVLASSGDPTTPIVAARRSLEDLEDAALVSLQADHHLAYHYALSDPGRPAYRCVLDTVEAYLIELELPPTQKECADDH